MIWRRVPNLFPIAAAVLAVNAPSLIVLGILGACGLLPVSLAVIAGAAIFILAALVVARPVRDLAIVRAAVDALSTDQGGGPLSQWTALKLVWPAGGLWRAIFRLDRLWRERVHAANEQLSAAEAVIAAAPDPLILLNQRRQIVGANIRATALVGATPERADLSVALRNPSALRRWMQCCGAKWPALSILPSQRQPNGSCAPVSRASIVRQRTAQSRC